MHIWYRLLVINVAATWLMVGLIWTMQLVHYPLFTKVGPQNWEDYHRDHARTITYIVGPTMLAEAATGLALLLWAKRFPMSIQACLLVGAGLLLVNWLSTIGVQVKIHNAISKNYDMALVGKLVASNWVRTIAWTLRGLLMAYVLASLLGKPMPAGGNS